jgi:hypothetical protein
MQNHRVVLPVLLLTIVNSNTWAQQSPDVVEGETAGPADGRNPAFIDILLLRHVDQAAVLGNYDDVTVAVVEMVGGG